MYKLLDLIKRGPVGGVLSSTTPNELQKDAGQKATKQVRAVTIFIIVVLFKCYFEI